jgi:alpha-tubulin suppressor-like RCC1 family protein
MSNRYKGGFISGTPPTTSGTPYTGNAGGMWTASQVFQAKASGLWPVTGPSAPTSLSVVPFNASATVTFSGATVTAGKPAITSYTVTAFPGGRFVTGAASPLTVTGLANNVLHTFTVSATNSDGTSIPSSGVTSTPAPMVPTAPTAISGNPQDGQVIVSFSGATVASGGPAISSYTVTVSPGGATVTGAASPITVTGLTNGENYTFTVVATNADGNSPASIVSAAIAPSAYVGKLFAWGYNTIGAIGDGTIINRSSPVQIGAGTNWSNIAGGYSLTISTKTDGTLWTWGQNNSGRLGQNNLVYRSSPVQVGTGTTWSKVAGGYEHNMATKTDGTLWTWGQNNFGQLGDSTGIDRSSPVQVGALTTWLNIAAGFYHSIATKTDGTLWSLGRNGTGQLGVGDQANRLSPVQVGAGTTWLNIAGGYAATIATKTDGTLWSWGGGSYGQLGLNTQGIASWKSSPAQIGAGTTWSKVSSGHSHILATKTDGTLWSWGRNDSGQLGQGNIINRSSPIQVGALTSWSKVMTGQSYSFATKTDGTLWSIGGYNNNGQTGDGTIVRKSSPVQIGTGTNWSDIPVCSHMHSLAIQGADLPEASVISSVEQTDTGKVTVSFTTPKLAGIATTWTATSSPGGLTASNVTGLPITVTGLSSGVPYTFTVRASTADGLGPKSAASSSITLTPTYIGRMWSWGSDNDGTLGLMSSNISRSSPVQIGTGTTWLNIAGGKGNTIATKTDGTLYGWGRNTFGELGLGAKGYKSSPVQVGIGTTWSNVAMGDNHTIATKTDGTLWTWGKGDEGQLGQGNTIYRSSPVQVGALTTWLNIAGGSNHTITNKTDGTLWSWGSNASGQLGNGTVIHRSSPVQIGALTTWLKIAANNINTAAIKTDGTLWLWGYNGYSKLGDGTIISRSSPVQVGAGTTWSNMAGGIYHTIATKTDGTLWAWGSNSWGQLGLGDIATRNSPVQVGAGTTWLNVSAGQLCTIVTKTDGTLWAWGRSDYGQLGQGGIINRSSPVQIGALTTWSKVADGLDHITAISGPVTGVTPTGVTVETIDTTATISYTPGV